MSTEGFTTRQWYKKPGELIYNQTSTAVTKGGSATDDISLDTESFDLLINRAATRDVTFTCAVTSPQGLDLGATLLAIYRECVIFKNIYLYS